MSNDIDSLPSQEDDRHEYKSSASKFEELKGKISKAASAFWNSGGGRLVVGVDNAGQPDGGVASMVGQQPLRDWIDQILYQVQPTGRYEITLYEAPDLPGFRIDSGRVVAHIQFNASHLVPHMAGDGRYYIGAGVHTAPATHFIVEALWSRRGLEQPKLLHFLRPKPNDSEILQLCVVNLSRAPALNVSLEIDPLPELWKDVQSPFPLLLPIIDQDSPFAMDISTFVMAQERIGAGRTIRLHYKDLAEREYSYEQNLYVKSYSPWQISRKL